MTTLDESTLVCPFLGLQNDVQTHFTVPDERHVCHQTNSGQAIHPDYQGQCCLTGGFRACKGYTTGWKHGLPRGVRLKNRRLPASNLQAVIRLAALAVVAAAMAFLLFQAHAASPGPVQTLPVTVPVPTQTLTPIPTIIVTATLPPSETPTELPLTPTAGPLAETPFGTARQWLVHRVVRGESLEMIAQRYATTVEVLRAVNYFVAGGLWADTSVVICMGCVDASGLPMLQPVWIEVDIRVDDLAVQYGMNSDELREWNGVEGDWILAGRWVIVAVN